MAQGVVSRIKVYPHPNADKLQCASGKGYNFIVGLDAKDDDLYILFGDDLKLSKEYCVANDLYPIKDEHGNRIGGGYLYISRKGKYIGLTLTIVSASDKFLDFLETNLKRLLNLDKNIRYKRDYMGCLMLHNKEVISLYKMVEGYNLPLMKRKQDNLTEYVLVKNDANYVDMEEIS